MAAGISNENNRTGWVREQLRLLPAGIRILDAGAGERPFQEYCSHLRYIAHDFSEYEGSGDQRGLQTGTWDQSNLDIVCDITKIPEPDSSFGAILCTEVLEHLPHPIAAIQEFSRLLQTGGYLILTAPFNSLTHFSPYHYYTGFNRNFYKFHLEMNCFEVLKLDTNGNYFEYLGQEVRRIVNVARQYSNDSPKRIEKYALRIVLKMLDRLSAKDKGSSELLCFGYHVLALKKP